MPDVPRPSRLALVGALGSALPDDATADSPRAVWQRAYVLAAMGRYADALTDLGGLVRHEDAATASAAHRLRASVWRQLALYDRAEDDGGRALNRAAQSQDGRPELAAGAAVGHVADAVGRLQAGEVGADAVLDDRLASAQARVRALPADVPQGWRHHVRLGWVAGEVAITRGDPGAASTAFTQALAAAQVAGAVRHVAKSTLFCAAVAAARHDAGVADQLAAEVVGAARRIGALPLVWPALLIRAEVAAVPAAVAAHHREAGRVLHGQLQGLPAALREDIGHRHPAAWLLREHRSGL